MTQHKEETDGRLLRPRSILVDEEKLGHDEEHEGNKFNEERHGISFRAEEDSKRCLAEELKSSKTLKVHPMEPPVCAYSARRNFRKRKAKIMNQ